MTEFSGKAVSFETFAYPRIVGAMYDGMRLVDGRGGHKREAERSAREVLASATAPPQEELVSIRQNVERLSARDRAFIDELIAGATLEEAGGVSRSALQAAVEAMSE